MSSEFGRKYHTVAIVAVSSTKVEDVLKVKVPRHLDCPADLGAEQSWVAGISNTDLLTVILLSALVSLLVLVLSAVLYHRRKGSPDLSLPHLSDHDSPAKKTGDAEKKKKVYGDADIEEGREGRGVRAVGNLYLPFPSNMPTRAAEEGEEEYSYISYDFDQ